MAANSLPRLMVMKAPYAKGYVNYEKKEGENAGGSVSCGAYSVFEPEAKIEVEQSKSNKKYVHLRFCHSNRYWQKATKGADHLYRLVAESNQPIEDTSNPSCTLFEPFSGPHIDVYYLRHVQTGRLVLFSRFSVSADENANANPEESSGHFFNVIECETLVQLPEHVALKGDNGKYLKAYQHDGAGRILRNQYYETDPYKNLSCHTVQQLPDGHVRIITDHFGKYWRFDTHNTLICPDSIDITPSDDNTLFWPVKIDGCTIALWSKTAGRFCNRRSADGIADLQAATDNTITAGAKLQVEELTLDRKIYYVDYRMEDARIFDEEPYLAGISHLINATNNQTSESVSITYLDEKSYTFSRGFSITTTDVKTSIEAGLPFIAEGKIEVSLKVSGNFRWDTTTTATTTCVSATGTVEVPPKSSVIVEYVGTRGTCNIPYSYTQLDKSAKDGKVKLTVMADGIYTGVSCYNFSFKMSAPKSIV